MRFAIIGPLNKLMRFLIMRFCKSSVLEVDYECMITGIEEFIKWT